ncbi:helix-turn-helix domain-containing protein [Mangrovicella endophytica]|uniref:helix-turn-helix domain-containing protein n=1 Tax=Mangrovicella endophytica TaxID=2066697 RepID=UPI000C9DB788|nr:helix-turn-helix domain-containing protein [Mangrovicella endophytica]
MSACEAATAFPPILTNLPGTSSAPVSRTIQNRVRCRLTREIASAVFDIAVSDIDRQNRAQAPICHARHVAMYLAHVVLQMPLTVIAAEFGRDRTSVAHAVRRIEDQRDDPDFDALLTRLERLAGAIDEALGQPEGADGRA